MCTSPTRRTTSSGQPAPGFAGDNGAATSAQLSSPTGLTVDSINNLYIADTANNRIRIVGPSGPVASVSPLSLPFPSISLSGSSGNSVTITNQGSAPLQISSVAITG